MKRHPLRILCQSSLFFCLTSADALDVVTSQYDNARTNANISEKILTPDNVTTATFGKLFARPVDGQVYTQPLYLENISINGASHNVVYICTEHNSVYAFDADDRAQTVPLWKRSLPPPVPSSDFNCNDLTPEIGVTATPVIDRSTYAMYVVARTKENGRYFNKLFALDCSTGTDLLPPTIIGAVVPGNGNGSVNGTISFDSQLQFCRTGLLLVNGILYFGFANLCDAGNYHGWLFGYRASTMARVAVFCATPNGGDGGIWQQGGGISSDGAAIYCTTGNGTFGQGNNNYGISVLRLDTLLHNSDFFTPHDAGTLNGQDLDLCSSVMLIPGTNYCTVQGKQAIIYLMNRSRLGGFNATSDNIVQRLDNGFASSDGNNPITVFWNDLYFLWPGRNDLRVFSFNGTSFSPTPQATNPFTQGPRAGAITLSADSLTNGILWGTSTNSGRFYAIDAAHAATVLWHDGLAASNRDLLGSPVQKYARPTVANGKVYVPTSNSLVVYGLLRPQTDLFGGGHATPVSSRVTIFFSSANGLTLVTGRPSLAYSATVTDLRGRPIALKTGFARGGGEQILPARSSIRSGAYCVRVIISGNRIPAKAIAWIR